MRKFKMAGHKQSVGDFSVKKTSLLPLIEHVWTSVTGLWKDMTNCNPANYIYEGQVSRIGFSQKVASVNLFGGC